MHRVITHLLFCVTENVFRLIKEVAQTFWCSKCFVRVALYSSRKWQTKGMLLNNHYARVNLFFQPQYDISYFLNDAAGMLWNTMH